MKTSALISLGIGTTCGFICSYFLNLTMSNFEQFLAICCVVLLDGFFGSALKNASMAGFINAEVLNKVLDKIDGHKGKR